MNFNKVVLLGKLTRDPEVRYTPSGTAVCDLGIAINRHWYDKQSQQKKEDVCFVDCTVWGRQAETAGEYLSKGRQVLVEGRLQLDQWEDKQSGQKRSKLKVVAENVQFVSNRGGGSQNDSSGGDRQPSQSPADSFYDQEVPF